MIPEILLVLLAVVLILAGIVLARTALLTRRIPAVEPIQPPAIDADQAAAHLSTAIQCQTVSTDAESEPPRQALLDLHQALRQMYPRLHAVLPPETVSEYSLLYTWPGRNPDLPGLLFAAHMDVVPAEPSPEWQYPPFSGALADGFIYGRGSLDNKQQVIALLEAVNWLLAQGYQPERTIYLAFGQDEEIGGSRGAGQIAELLKGRGVRLAAVLDEGGAVVSGVFPGVDAPVASIGIGEKGYLTLILTAEAAPGHSSTPPPETAIGILARALARLESRPLPARLDAMRPLFQAIAGAASFPLQVVFANLWLFGGLLKKRLLANPQTAASLRTTTAITIISGGVKDNILPQQAKAHVNFRILTGESIASTCDYVRRVIADRRVRFEAAGGFGSEPSPSSPTQTPIYHTLERTIRQLFGAIPIAPYIVQGATDARYYTALSEAVYRFTPVSLHVSELKSIHGQNERISRENLARMVQFYAHLLQEWGKASL